MNVRTQMIGLLLWRGVASQCTHFVGVKTVNVHALAGELVNHRRVDFIVVETLVDVQT